MTAQDMVAGAGADTGQDRIAPTWRRLFGRPIAVVVGLAIAYGVFLTLTGQSRRAQ